MLSRRRLFTGIAAAGVAVATERVEAAIAEPRRLIVDSQIHMWPANTPERPWVVGAKPQLPEPFTIERVVPMIDDAGVDRVVIVPPTLEGERLGYAQEAVRRYPGRFGIMARIWVDKPDRAQRLASLRNQPGVLGVRLNFIGSEGAWLTDGTADWFWPAAEKAGLPVMFLTSGQTSLFARIAERHPQLILIIDHMGVGAGLRPRAGSSGVVANNLVPEAIAQAGRSRKLSERVGEAVVGAADLNRILSIPRYDPSYPSPVRRIWTAALPLGDRRDQFARQGYLSPTGDSIHRGTDFSVGERQGLDHGSLDPRTAQMGLRPL
jgi:predicted TIM-barrel fold metal-dependent hydrolase